MSKIEEFECMCCMTTEEFISFYEGQGCGNDQNQELWYVYAKRLGMTEE